MINSIMRKLHLAFAMPPKPPIRWRDPTARCPHCGKSTRVLTAEDMERRKQKLKILEEKQWLVKKK